MFAVFVSRGSCLDGWAKGRESFSTTLGGCSGWGGKEGGQTGNGGKMFQIKITLSQ